MAKDLEMMIKTEDPDWKDIDTILEMLFDKITGRWFLRLVKDLSKSKPWLEPFAEIWN